MTDAERKIYELTDSYLEAVGGQLTALTMEKLNADQHTLLAYRILLDEVREGGFIQLIQNGWGPYVLEGPFPMMMKKQWGFEEFGKFMYKVKKEYMPHKEELEAEMSDEDFMALYEQYDKLNNLGDDFLDIEEEMTPLVAEYVEKHKETFVL